MSSPLVSIIIPAFNSEKHLEASIRSALDQTWSNKEVLVIDDGSSDRSANIARSFESEGVRVFTQENKGASAARNKGLREAKGEYIQFLDADDLIAPEKTEQQVAILQQHPGCLATGPTVYFGSDEDPFSKTALSNWVSSGSDDTIDFLVRLYGGYGQEYASMIALHSWLSPRSILEKAGPWNEGLSLDDDGEYFCRVLLQAGGVRYSAGAVSYYRKYQTNRNLSRQTSEKALQSAFQSIVLKSKYLLTLTGTDETKKALSRCFWEVAVSSYPGSAEISKQAMEQARKLWPDTPAYLYTHTAFYRTVTKLFGWKASAWISYLKNRK